MDSELLSLCPPPPPLAYSLPLTSSLTLSTKTGLAFLADSHQRTRRVIWLYMSKRVWLSLQNVLFIRWGLDAALPLFLICWQNKPVRQHNTEHVANSYTCISVHFYFDPITFAPKKQKRMVDCTTKHPQNKQLLDHHCPFSCIWAKCCILNDLSWSGSPLCSCASVIGRKGCKCTAQSNVMHLMWQAIDTVRCGVRWFVFSVSHRWSLLWCYLAHLDRRCPIISQPELVNKSHMDLHVVC